ncbi:MAG: hypothetical protein ABFR75_13655 [Acidobacteriota bacterium]
MRRIIFIIIVSGLFLTIFNSDIFGIPAFARKHKLSCKTCHDPYPRLKPFGEEFAGDGFTIKDKKQLRYFTKTGDDKLSLLRSLPIAVRMDNFLTYNRSNQNITDLSLPYNIKLLSGGSLAKNISYYFYFFFSERGKIVGIEDAFIMFNDIFKTGISLSVGQFQISDPLFKRELRLTYEDYHIYKTRPGLSGLNLTYDRGIMLNYTFEKGGPDVVLEILNGTGIDEADNFKNFDNDKYKNIFFRISQGLGDKLRIGASGYFGKEKPGKITNDMWMLGGDLTLSLFPVEINVQYMKRCDKNPFLTNVNPAEINTSGGFAELIYTFGGVDSRLYGVALFNWVDSDLNIHDYKSAAIHLDYLIQRNIRLVLEANYIFKGPYGEHIRLLAGLIAAF